MTDLGKQLREHFDAAGPPLDIEAIVSEAPRPKARRPRKAVVGTVTAAAVVVLALLALATLFQEQTALPIVENPPTQGADSIEDREQTELGIRPTDRSERGIEVGDAPTAPTAPATDHDPEPSLSPSRGTDAVRTLPVGRILYEHNNVVRILVLGGGDPRDIASGFQPRWSPDGSRVSYRDDVGLWTARTDGTSKVQVAGSEVDLDGAPFSPDGSRLLYTVGLYDCGADAPPLPPFGCAPSSDTGIWSVGVDGASPRRLATGVAWHPVWSPDGSRIAYSRDDRIYVADADGGDERLVYQPNIEAKADRPQFSPDGTQLAFYVTLDAEAGSSEPCGPRMQLWIADVGGTEAAPLAQGPFRPGSAGGAWLRAPQWSPDGTMITFADALQVWVVNTRDGHARSVMATREPDCEFPTADAGPAWSPDGAFVIAYTRLSERSPVGLFAVRPDGFESHLLVSGRSSTPTWRP